MMLHFAYSTINWGDTCDLPTALAEIRQAGWGAVELFAHTLDWLGPRERLVDDLGGLTVATLFGEDPIAHLRKYRPRTGYIHLKDWGRGKFVEMGRGTIGIDFPAILGELENQGFAGWVVIEQSTSDISPLHSAQINAEYLRGL